MSGRAQDSYGHRAKREGYLARSVYKLEALDQRFHLLRRGQRVLDLGASPGSWTQFALEKVGREGKVVAIDINPLAFPGAANATLLTRDIHAEPLDDVLALGPFDLVISDMAPATSGDRFVDQCKSFDLFDRAVSIALATLAPGGGFVGKIFQGPDFENACKRVKSRFSEMKTFKPPASRSKSYETFVVGKGFKS